MNLVNNTVVDSITYEKLVPGVLKSSSREKPWDGFHFMHTNPPSICTNSSRPSTSDHTLFFNEVGEVEKGRYCINSSHWRKFEWRSKTFFIAQAFANDRDLRWEVSDKNQSNLSVWYLNVAPKHLTKAALEAADKTPKIIELPHKLGVPDPLMYSLGLTIKQELEKNNPFGEVFIETAISFLAIHMLKEYCTISFKIPDYQSTLDSQRLIRIKEYINGHLDRDITLDAMAKIACMSTYHFARIFKNTLGLPPYKYIMQQRIKKAEQLLSSTDTPINLIAIEVGYSSSNFFQAFKKVTGYTPSAYRKSTRKNLIINY